MADDDFTSPEWTKQAVVRQLRQQSAGHRAVRAQVFLDDTISVADLGTTVDRIVRDAAHKAGAARGIKVGKIHNLAKSFSIDASPEVVEAIAEMPSVKSILPSEIADIYPKPVQASKRAK